MKTSFNILVISIAFLCLAQRIKTEEVKEEVMQKRLIGEKTQFFLRPPSFFAFIEIYSREASITEEPDAISRTCVGALTLPHVVISAASCFEPFKDITKVIVRLPKPVGTFEVQSRKARHIGYWQNEMACVECDSYPPFQPNLVEVVLEIPFASINVLKNCESDYWDEKPLPGREVYIVNQKRGRWQQIEMEVTETEGKCKKAKEQNLYDGHDVLCAVGLQLRVTYGKKRRGLRKSTETKIEKVGFNESRNTCYGDTGAPVIASDKLDKLGHPRCLVGIVNGGMSFPVEGDVKSRDRCYGGTTITTFRYTESAPLSYFSNYHEFAKQQNKATVEKAFVPFFETRRG